MERESINAAPEPSSDSLEITMTMHRLEIVVQPADIRWKVVWQ